MELVDLVNYLKVGCPILLILASFIKFKKVEVNFWGWLFKKIGKSLNSDLLKEVQSVKEDVQKMDDRLNEHIKEMEVIEAKGDRRRILRFNDEIYNGEEHSKEHYDELMRSIDSYETYCKNHDDFPNNQAECAIENIKANYNKRLENKSFMR